jgi:hypothetical protein
MRGVFGPLPSFPRDIFASLDFGLPVSGSQQEWGFSCGVVTRVVRRRRGWLASSWIIAKMKPGFCQIRNVLLAGTHSANTNNWGDKMDLLYHNAKSATIQLDEQELLMITALIQEVRNSFGCDSSTDQALDELFTAAVGAVVLVEEARKTSQAMRKTC